MQSPEILFDKIRKERPDIDDADVIEQWIYYLQQLKGCRLLSAVAQDLDEETWLDTRTIGIGGSDIAGIMGESPWSSPRQIWLRKTGQFDDKDVSQSEAARWGNVLETTIATEWGKRNEKNWVHIPVTLQMEDAPWRIANVDGFVLSEDKKEIIGILEIKTTSTYNNNIWENGPLPFYYICQATWYCMITGLEAFDLVCLVGGQRLYGYHFPADTDLIKRMKEEGDKFWHINVLRMVEPPAAAADIDAFKKAVIDEEAPVLVLEDDESDRLVESYIQIREKISALESIKKEIYAQLYGIVGASSEAMTKTHTIVVKQTQRRTCDLELLQTIFPEAYNQCVKFTVSKSLNIK